MKTTKINSIYCVHIRCLIASDKGDANMLIAEENERGATVKDVEECFGVSTSTILRICKIREILVGKNSKKEIAAYQN